MRGARPLAVLLILSMLSACAGTTRHHAKDMAANADMASPDSHAEAVEADAVGEDDLDGLTSGHQHTSRVDHRYRTDGVEARFHEQPTPGERAFAEAALLITGSVFLCTFVVVVLDGACDIGAHAGYYYY